MAELIFKDGRAIQTGDSGALKYVYLDKDGKEYTLTRSLIAQNVYNETSARQLIRWQCVFGHDWWANPDDENPSCFRCRTVVGVLRRMFDR